MYRLVFLLVGLITYSRATPCNEVPPSALAAFPSVGGWIPEIGENLFEVSQALGIQDLGIIPSLNQDIGNPGEVFAGSTYCIPYTSPVISAFWSTSGTFPWLKLEFPTAPVTSPTFPITETSLASISVSQPSTYTSTSLISLASTSVSQPNTYASTSLISLASTPVSQSTYISMSTSSATVPLSFTTTYMPLNSMTTGSPAIIIGTPCEFLTTQVPLQYYVGLTSDIPQCRQDCGLDPKCEAFIWDEATQECRLFECLIF